MPPVVVTGRHRPHEVALLGFSAILGLAFVVGLKPPGSIELLVPGWLRWTWYLLLLASGLVGIVAVLLDDVYAALACERAAMWGQSAAFTMYALAIFALGGWRGLTAGGLCLALAAASVVRLRQIFGEMKLLRRAVEGT